MKFIYITTLLLLFHSQTPLCQTIIQGKVTLQKGDVRHQEEPLLGAAISIKGTSLWKSTNLDGRFYFEVSDSLTENHLDDSLELMVTYPRFTAKEFKIPFKSASRLIRSVGSEEKLYTNVLIKAEENSFTVASDLVRSSSNAYIRYPEYGSTTVYFATDRNKTNTSDPTKMFGAQRGKLVSYGYCKVSIPESHDRGKLESPNFWKLEFKFDPDKHVALMETKVKSSTEFFEMLNDSLETSPEKKALLFIHGYNVTFEDAARRTAQMSYDLGFDGIPTFYSWPSKGTTFKYTVDEATIELSETYLQTFLIDFLSRTTTQNVYIIGHSMGNRAMANAVSAVIDKEPELAKKIKEIVLAAPDIDAEVFKTKIAPQLTKRNHPVTLYASSQDKALFASKFIHGEPRAGDSENGITIVKGVESIDATGMDTGFLQHSYVGSSDSVISDLFYIIKLSLRPDNRSNLIRRSISSNSFYWVFR